MKLFGWPRPPLILGLAIGGIFERYLFISTELDGARFLLHPFVIAVLVVIVWVLYRPLAQIFAGMRRNALWTTSGRLRLRPMTAFTAIVLTACIAAVISATEWPMEAKLVPLTACGIALIATFLNLVAELFGAEAPASRAAPLEGAGDEQLTDLPAGVLRWRAIGFFFWLGVFAVSVAIVGFLPAIAVFIFLYMRFGFGEGAVMSATCALGMAVACFLVFDLGLNVVWPHSVLGELFPAAREIFDFI
jgi:hypothetical protein